MLKTPQSINRNKAGHGTAIPTSTKLNNIKTESSAMSIYTPSAEDIKKQFGYFPIEAPTREELKEEYCSVGGNPLMQKIATEAARLVNTGRPQTKEHKLKRAMTQYKGVIVNGIEYKSQNEAAINNNVLPSVICELIKVQGRTITLEKGNITCPHCGQTGKNPRAMKRWHYDNCKKKG